MYFVIFVKHLTKYMRCYKMKKGLFIIISILFLLAIGNGFGLIIGNDYTFNTNNQFATRSGSGFEDTGWPYHCKYTTVHAENVGVSADFEAPYEGTAGGCEWTNDPADYAYQHYRTNIFEVQTTGYYNVHFTYKIVIRYPALLFVCTIKNFCT